MKTVGLVSKIVMFAVIIISVVLVALIVSGNEASDDVLAKGAGSWTGSTITWTIAVLVIAVAGAVCSEVFGMVQNPKGIVKSLIVVVGVAALVAICWGLADGTPLKLPGYEGTDNQSPWLEIADTGIFLFYFSAGAAVLSIIASEVYNMTK